MHPALARRLLWNVLPVVLVVGAVWVAFVGKDGLLKRHEVKGELARMESRTERLKAENAELERQIRALRSEQVALQRATAETLLMAPAGSTIYRFASPSAQ